MRNTPFPIHQWQKDILERVMSAHKDGTRLIISYPPRHGRAVMQKQLDEWVRVHIEGR